MYTRILFVRHGETEGNLSGCFYDEPGYGLTEIGEQQARVAGEKLYELTGGEKVDVVYCSPWERAKKTCDLALSHGNVRCSAVVYDERLRERSFAGLVGKKVNHDGRYNGDTEAISLSEYREIWTFDSPMSKNLGIETLPELKERVEDFLYDMTKWHPDKTVIVFSHGGVCRMMWTLCNRWPYAGRLYQIPFVNNGEIVEFIFRNFVHE